MSSFKIGDIVRIINENSALHGKYAEILEEEKDLALNNITNKKLKDLQYKILTIEDAPNSLRYHLYSKPEYLESVDSNTVEFIRLKLKQGPQKKDSNMGKFKIGDIVRIIKSTSSNYGEYVEITKEVITTNVSYEVKSFYNDFRPIYIAEFLELAGVQFKIGDCVVIGNNQTRKAIITGVYDDNGSRRSSIHINVYDIKYVGGGIAHVKESLLKLVEYEVGDSVIIQHTTPIKNLSDGYNYEMRYQHCGGIIREKIHFNGKTIYKVSNKNDTIYFGMFDLSWLDKTATCARNLTSESLASPLKFDKPSPDLSPKENMNKTISLTSGSATGTNPAISLTSTASPATVDVKIEKAFPDKDKAELKINEASMSPPIPPSYTTASSRDRAVSFAALFLSTNPEKFVSALTAQFDEVRQEGRREISAISLEEDIHNTRKAVISLLTQGKMASAIEAKKAVFEFEALRKQSKPWRLGGLVSFLKWLFS